jgi:hypothetical protein
MMYIAPEVHRGEHFDERSDVYSFSIVMWEMVTSKVLICCLCIVFYVRLCVICGREQNVYACLQIFLTTCPDLLVQTPFADKPVASIPGIVGWGQQRPSTSVRHLQHNAP